MGIRMTDKVRILTCEKCGHEQVVRINKKSWRCSVCSAVNKIAKGLRRR